MKMIRWTFPLILALALTACSGAPSTNASVPTVVLNPSGSSGGNTASAASAAGSVSASAEAVPATRINLSFSLGGMVKTVVVEVGDNVSSGDVLASLDTTILEARVAEAQAGVDSAATRVRYLRRVGPGDEQLNAAIADVDRANAILDQMKATMDQASIITPIDGTVISVDVAPGETAVPGKVVVVVADLKNMQIETTDLSERDVASVKVGQPVTVFIEALGGDFPGKVTDIARNSETVGGDVVYKVTIALDEQPEGLRWGMSADVTIQTEQ